VSNGVPLHRASARVTIQHFCRGVVALLVTGHWCLVIVDGIVVCRVLVLVVVVNIEMCCDTYARCTNSIATYILNELYIRYVFMTSEMRRSTAQSQPQPHTAAAHRRRRPKSQITTTMAMTTSLCRRLGNLSLQLPKQPVPAVRSLLTSCRLNGSQSTILSQSVGSSSSVCNILKDRRLSRTHNVVLKYFSTAATTVTEASGDSNAAAPSVTSPKILRTDDGLVAPTACCHRHHNRSQLQ
jgi:hypothetical protein